MTSQDPSLDAAIENNINPCGIDGTESAGSASMGSLERIGECNLEPMETVETNSSASSQAKNLDVEDVEEDDKLDDKDAEVDIKEDLPIQDVVMKETERKEEDEDYQLSIDDLFLLCDVFYLPFEHGPQGKLFDSLFKTHMGYMLFELHRNYTGIFF